MRVQRARCHVTCATAPGPHPIKNSAWPLPSTYRRLVAKHCGDSFIDVVCVKEFPLSRPGPGQAGDWWLQHVQIGCGLDFSAQQSQVGFARSFSPFKFTMPGYLLAKVWMPLEEWFRWIFTMFFSPKPRCPKYCSQHTVHICLWNCFLCCAACSSQDMCPIKSVSRCNING